MLLCLPKIRWLDDLLVHTYNTRAKLTLLLELANRGYLTTLACIRTIRLGWLFIDYLIASLTPSLGAFDCPPPCWRILVPLRTSCPHSLFTTTVHVNKHACLYLSELFIFSVYILQPPFTRLLNTTNDNDWHSPHI